MSRVGHPMSRFVYRWIHFFLSKKYTAYFRDDWFAVYVRYALGAVYDEVNGRMRTYTLSTCIIFLYAT